MYKYFQSLTTFLATSSALSLDSREGDEVMTLAGGGEVEVLENFM